MIYVQTELIVVCMSSTQQMIKGIAALVTFTGIITLVIHLYLNDMVAD